MSFGTRFGNPLSRMMSSAPAIIEEQRATGVERGVDIIGMNGTTGTAVAPDVDSDDEKIPDVPLTFDQETNLLVRMNEQQSKTIGELQARIAQLEKELVEKPVPPICYIKCLHCMEQDAQ